jgi:hypothetical protein
LQVRVREIDRGKVSLELVDALEGATLPDAEAPKGGGGNRSRDRDRGRGGRGRDSRDDRRDRVGSDGGDKSADKSADKVDAGESGGNRRAAPSFDETFEKMSGN